jgi:3-oxocholest-4-en-26-oate---CoA ligase
MTTGLKPDETAGLYMPDSAAYVESLLACMLARLIPVNINYRYTGSELAHLLTAGKLAGLIVDAQYAPLAAAVAADNPDLRHVLVTGDGGTLAASFPPGITVRDYDTAIATAPPMHPDNGRSGDDKIIIFTGGTTGLPKGVLWRHQDFYFSLLLGANPLGAPHLAVGEVVAAARERSPGGVVNTAPLMHGAGTINVLLGLLIGVKVILSRKFDPAQALRLASAEQATGLLVIGDAMARPIADEPAAHPGEYDLSSPVLLGSTGVRLSPSVRERLLAMCPNLLISDALGSSETGSTGLLTPGKDSRPRLIPRGNATVLDETLRPVEPGGTGQVARSGHVPLGNYGDEAATEAKFPVIDGVRWARLGDMAEVDRDGSIILLGRGSMCINTGGEKVYPRKSSRRSQRIPRSLTPSWPGYWTSDSASASPPSSAAPQRRGPTRTHCGSTAGARWPVTRYRPGSGSSPR